MKALTLRHPWPFAICHWGKRLENRTWKPPESLIGQRFAIHGGKPSTSPAVRREITRIAWDLRIVHGLPAGFDTITFEDIFKCVGICCTAVLSEVVEESKDPWFDGSGYGWVLRDVIVLPEPIAISGAQGLWKVPQDVVEEIERLTAQLAPRRTDLSGRDVTDLPGLWDETDKKTDARGSSLGE